MSTVPCIFRLICKFINILDNFIDGHFDRVYNYSFFKEKVCNSSHETRSNGLIYYVDLKISNFIPTVFCF